MDTIRPMSEFKDAFWGPTGFDELRKLMKQGSDFTKELVNIIHERADLENTYSKGLSKLATKLAKASRDVAAGTVANAWEVVATEMDREAELHRTLSLSLEDEAARPLRTLHEAQSKTRKNVEASVDKKVKHLQDRRNEEVKLKRLSYQCARDNERLQESDSGKVSRSGKILTDKDMNKIDSKRRKAEEALVKADLEYYAACLSAERSRQEWELCAYQSADWLQRLEESRLATTAEVVERYVQLLQRLAPAHAQCCQRIISAVEAADAVGDIGREIEQRGTSPNIPEQVLPDFYAEDLQNPMRLERRKTSLEKFLMLVKRDLELERKGREGVETLARALEETPTFGDDQPVNEKLKQLKQTLAFLEATRYKIQCVLSSLEGEMRPAHPLCAHIEQHRDKQGLPKSILKVPPWLVGSERLRSPRQLNASLRRSPTPSMAPSVISVRAPRSVTSSLGRSHSVIQSLGSGTLTRRATMHAVNGSRTGNHNEANRSRQNSGDSLPRHHSSEEEEEGEGSDVTGEEDRGHGDGQSGGNNDDISDDVYSTTSSQDSVDCGKSLPVGGAPAPVKKPARNRKPSGNTNNHRKLSEGEISNGGTEKSLKLRPGATLRRTTGIPAPDNTYCRAIYDYEPAYDDELRMRAGDVIRVLEMHADDWWSGQLNGMNGLFPATYVKLM